jgi:hypothetical protein
MGYNQMRGTHRVKRVNYQLYDGSTSYVEVPVEDYNAENVKAALQQAAKTHIEVMSIEP